MSPMLRLPSSHMPPLIQRFICRRRRLLLVVLFPLFSYALVVQAAHALFQLFFSTGALPAFLLLYYYPLLFALSALHYLGFCFIRYRCIPCSITSRSFEMPLYTITSPPSAWSGFISFFRFTCCLIVFYVSCLDAPLDLCGLAFESLASR